jgi:hypothetical protein
VREADQPARLAEGSSTSKLENLSLQHLKFCINAHSKEEDVKDVWLPKARRADDQAL